MPAGSSAETVAGDQLLWPNASTAVGFAIPSPSSLMRSVPSPVRTATRVAFARRAFCSSSLTTCSVEASKKRLTLLIAPGSIAAWM